MVLEHSPGYHTIGVELLTQAIRLLALAGLPQQPAWQDKLARARTFTALITRPDGSLPLLGDTRAPLSNSTTGGHRTRNAKGIYPVSGYAMWRRQSMNESSQAHMTVTWSNFDGHGHKHADELSFELWADGQPWLSSVGYWPYDDSRRRLAVGWQGSNAPHYSGEATNSSRAIAIANMGTTDAVIAVELERRNDSGFVVRRQIIDIDSRIWIVLDAYRGAPTPGVEVVFNFSSRVRSGTMSSSNCHAMDGSVSPRTMEVCFVAPTGLKVLPLFGDTSPFGGWEIDAERRINPAPALRISHPAPAAWLASIWSISATHPLTPQVAWESPSSWRITLSKADPPTTISRHDKVISISGFSGQLAGEHAVTLHPLSNPSEEHRRINGALQRTAKRYPKTENLFIDYRLRVLAVLALLWVAQELVLFGIARTSWKRFTISLRGLSFVCWLLGGIWLHQAYFVA